MKIRKEKVKEWFEDRLEAIRIWWKWNYDWFLVATGAIIFGVLLGMFGCYCEYEEDRKYDYEIHYGKDGRLRCNEEDITREGHTLIIKRGETTYVLTNYTLEDNRHIK